MASCNPVFYEIAYRLDARDPGLLPDMARGFGFGQPTGIGLPEAAGLVPDPRDPDWKEKAVGDPNPWFSGDSVVLGIGQGYLLVTPIQIANAYAAIARGGELDRPLLVRKITDAQGNVVREFRTEAIGRLPVSQATLDAIREGLRLVTRAPAVRPMLPSRAPAWMQPASRARPRRPAASAPITASSWPTPPAPARPG